MYVHETNIALAPTDLHVNVLEREMNNELLKKLNLWPTAKTLSLNIHG